MTPEEHKETVISTNPDHRRVQEAMARYTAGATLSDELKGDKLQADSAAGALYKTLYSMKDPQIKLLCDTARKSPAARNGATMMLTLRDFTNALRTKEKQERLETQAAQYASMPLSQDLDVENPRFNLYNRFTPEGQEQTFQLAEKNARRTLKTEIDLDALVGGIESVHRRNSIKEAAGYFLPTKKNLREHPSRFIPFKNIIPHAELASDHHWPADVCVASCLTNLGYHAVLGYGIYRAAEAAIKLFF